MKANHLVPLLLSALFLFAATTSADMQYTFNINMLSDPYLAGSSSVRYDDATGKFLALYIQPELHLARCDPNGCASEVVDADLDVGPRAFLLRDNEGLLALYSAGEDNTPRLAREGVAGWTAVDLSLPLDTPIVYSAAIDPAGALGLLVNDADEIQYYCRSEKFAVWQCEPRTYYEGGQSLAYDSQGLAHVFDLQYIDDNWLLVHAWRNAAGEWEEETIASLETALSKAFLAVNTQDELFLYYNGGFMENYYIYGYKYEAATPTWRRVTRLVYTLDFFFSDDMGNLAFDHDGYPVYTYSYSGEDNFSPDWPPPIYYSLMYVGGNDPWTVFEWSYQGSLFVPIPETVGYIQHDEMNKSHLFTLNEQSGYRSLNYRYDRPPATVGWTVSRLLSIEDWIPMAVAALPAEGGLMPYLFANRRYSESWSLTDVFTYAPTEWKVKWSIADADTFAPGRNSPLVVSPEGMHFVWSQYNPNYNFDWSLVTYHDGLLTREPLASYPEQFAVGQVAMHSTDDLLIAISEYSCGSIHFARRPPGGPVGEFVEFGINTDSPAITACSDGLARIVYFDTGVDDLILATEGDPFTLETVAESLYLSTDYSLAITCDDTNALRIYYSTDEGIFVAADAGDGWTSELLWAEAALGGVVEDELGRPIVGFLDQNQTAKLAHWTESGWEVETLADDASLPMALWSDDGDLIACYLLQNSFAQRYIQCRSTAAFVEDPYPGDDDTIDDDVVDDDSVDDDVVDDDTTDDDSADDDVVDDDTTDDDSADDDVVDDDTVDDDTLDDDTVDDDVTDDDVTPDDDDSTPSDDDDSFPPPGDDDNDDNNDGCGS